MDIEQQLGKGGSAVNIQPMKEIDWKKKEDFFATCWETNEMHVNNQTYVLPELEGFCVQEDGVLAAAITYTYEGSIGLIVSLDSIIEKQGHASHLLMHTEEYLKKAGVEDLRVVITNENEYALRFYRRRGFQLASVHVDAARRAREDKPSIPLVGVNGITIRDEWHLRKWL
jgi:GNAT superfamily N-acetyltransferase